MNVREMFGLVLLSIGVVLIIFGFHQLGYIPEEKPKMEIITNSPISPTEHFPENAPIIVTSEGNGSFPLVAGIALLLIGGAIAIYYRNSFGA